MERSVVCGTGSIARVGITAVKASSKEIGAAGSTFRTTSDKARSRSASVPRIAGNRIIYKKPLAEMGLGRSMSNCGDYGLASPSTQPQMAGSALKRLNNSKGSEGFDVGTTSISLR